MEEGAQPGEGWETVCTMLEELEAFVEGLAASEDGSEKAMHELLSKSELAAAVAVAGLASATQQAPAQQQQGQCLLWPATWRGGTSVCSQSRL